MKIAAIFCTLLGLAVTEPELYYQSQPSSNSIGSTTYGHQNQLGYNTLGNYGYGQSTGNSGSSLQGSKSYGINSDLRQIIQPVENDLSRELQQSIQNKYRQSSAYSNNISPSQLEADKRILEQELKSSIDKKIFDAVRARYGVQGIKGSYSYSIVNGIFQSSANYHIDELEDLILQTKNILLKQLDQGIQRYYYTGPHHGINTNLRQILQQVENDLSQELEKSIQTKYRQSSAYSTDISPFQIREDKIFLQQELRRNIPKRIDDALRAYYGIQGVQGSQSFSIVNGIFKPTANYEIQELENLTHQTENNLLRHLEEEIQRYYYRYLPSTTQRPLYPIWDPVTNITVRVQSNLNYYLDKVLEETHRRYFSSRLSGRPIDYHWNIILFELERDLRNNITFQLNEEIRRTYGNANYDASEFENFKRVTEQTLKERLNREFNRQKETYLHGYGNPPIDYTNPNQINWSLIKTQLHEELSRQLQIALAEQQRLLAITYSSSLAVGPQVNRQTALQQLTAEINQNLTRLLDQKLHQLNYSGRGSIHSGSDVQLTNVKSELKNELLREMREGLNQPYNKFGSSSPSSNYRQTRSIYITKQENENSLKDYIVDDEIGGKPDTPEVLREKTMKTFLQ